MKKDKQDKQMEMFPKEEKDKMKMLKEHFERREGRMRYDREKTLYVTEEG